MAQYSYAIASGWDADPGDLDNIEDLIGIAPQSQPLPRGSVKRRTLDKATQYNGTVSAFWKFKATANRDAIDTLLAYLGDVTLGSAPVTIRTRSELDQWSIYNAQMVNPNSGEDWERAVGGYGAAEPLTIEFVIDALTFDEILDELGFPILDENGDILLA